MRLPFFHFGMYLVLWLSIWVLSVICILLGLAVETIPQFWRGLLLGLGLGFSGALLILYPKTDIDVTSFPEPSAAVRAKCDDPNCSLVDAVKLYREETGAGLSEAAAVLKAYLAESERG